MSCQWDSIAWLAMPIRILRRGPSALDQVEARSLDAVKPLPLVQGLHVVHGMKPNRPIRLLYCTVEAFTVADQ